MISPQRDAVPMGNVDADAIIRRFGPNGERAMRVLAPIGKLMVPVLLLLGLVVVPVILVAPLALPALVVAAVVQATGLGRPTLAGGAVAMVGLIAFVAVPRVKEGAIAYWDGLSRVSRKIPLIVSVKAGEVVILHHKIETTAPGEGPRWTFAEADGPGVVIVRGGREVIWNGTRSGYAQWCRETDFASL